MSDDMSKTDFPIDAVIAWVDGNDPVHRSKRLKYGSVGELDNDEVGGDIRFTSVGEIKYCVASLLRFAPYIRTIYIVTDDQDPDLNGFLDRHFPDRSTRVEIVDHKVLYKGYEEYLPVFNSLSIETLLYRIPGLNEHFVYLNDDFMLVAPTDPETFFRDGRAVCYATLFNLPFARFLRFIKPPRHGHKIFGFKDSMINAADAAGGKWTFPYIGHIPLALKKTVVEDFYKDHKKLFLDNIRPRFREPHQFNPQVLYYMLAEKCGDCIVVPRKGTDLYVKPNGKEGYMQKKLDSFDASSTALFCCFNSLDYASPEDQQLAISWLEKRLGLI